MHNRKILISGVPHSGKSTLLNKLLQNTKDKQGFITFEIQESGQRTGFKISTAKGTEVMLASVHVNTFIKVSKYSVSVENIDSIMSELQNFNKGDVLYIDEIGQMELSSEKFKKLVEKYLDSDNLFLGTITKVYSDDFTKSLLSRNDIKVFEITPENRDEIYSQLKALVI